MWLTRTSVATCAGAALVVAALAAASGYSVMRARERTDLAARLTGGDPARASAHMIRYGCAGCHMIPGVPGADGLAGPPLDRLRQRLYIGGMLRNTPDDLIEWIKNPRAINPRTAMPVTGISEQEARDVAAYLYAR